MNSEMKNMAYWKAKNQASHTSPLEAAPTKQLGTLIKYGTKAAKGAYNLGKKIYKKIKGPKRTKDPAYRYNEPQRGARNPDGTRR